MKKLLSLVIILYLQALICCRSVRHHNFSNRWIMSGVHDSSCFTQGFSFINNTHILESCGMYGQSFYHVLQYSVWNQNQTQLKETYRSEVFPDDIFLEGSAFFPLNNIIYILTWKENVVIRINPENFEQIQPRLRWQKQGWGMTNNETHLFISTGSNQIFVVDQNINILETHPILFQDGRKVSNINEIQWVQQQGIQYIYANIWGSTSVVKINLQQNRVVHRFQEYKMAKDSKLHVEVGQMQDVLNGIAYHKQTNVFLLTGKKWPRYYLSYLDRII